MVQDEGQAGTNNIYQPMATRITTVAVGLSRGIIKFSERRSSCGCEIKM